MKRSKNTAVKLIKTSRFSSPSAHFFATQTQMTPWSQRSPGYIKCLTWKIFANILSSQSLWLAFLFMPCTNEAYTKYSLTSRDNSLVSDIVKKNYDFQALQKRFEQVYGVCKRMDQEICDVIPSTYCFIRHQDSSFSSWSLFKQTIVPTRPFVWSVTCFPYIVELINHLETRVELIKVEFLMIGIILTHWKN